MQHLEVVGMGYFQHLIHTWRLAGILIIHGIFPWIWENKVADQLMLSIRVQDLIAVKVKALVDRRKKSD